MFMLTIQRFFEAAHRLPDSEFLTTKKCINLHGHTYHVVVDLQGFNDKMGMVVDFGLVKEVIDKYDHQFLNDLFGEIPTTAENITFQIYKDLVKAVPNGVEIRRVKVAEGYKGPENTSYVVYTP